MSKNFDAFLKLKKVGLEEKYVVIVKGKVVGKGKDIEKLLPRVKRQYPKEIPLVAKIPSDEVLILWMDIFSKFRVIFDERKGFIDFEE